jgi:hypothetical protein
MAVPGDKIHKGAGVLASGSAGELYHGLVSSWRDPASVVIGGESRRPCSPATCRRSTGSARSSG